MLIIFNILVLLIILYLFNILVLFDILFIFIILVILLYVIILYKYTLYFPLMKGQVEFEIENYLKCSLLNKNILLPYKL